MGHALHHAHFGMYGKNVLVTAVYVKISTGESQNKVVVFLFY